VKLAYPVAGPGGFRVRTSPRAKLLLLGVLVSPIFFGWVIGKFRANA
jgi:hypothetical protein